jgi:hypothetical protein
MDSANNSNGENLAILYIIKIAPRINSCSLGDTACARSIERSEILSSGEGLKKARRKGRRKARQLLDFPEDGRIDARPCGPKAFSC